MTTNAGSNLKGGGIGFGKTEGEMDREKAVKALNEFLRPEFINRVDEIVCFNKLSKENFRGIAVLMLTELRDVMAEKNMALTWDDAAVDYLTEKSYSVTYGARNLRRLLQKEVEDAIAGEIIDKRRGAVSHIGLTAKDGKIEILAI